VSDTLTTHARRIRRECLRMVTAAGRGHIGGSLSAVDILVALYFGDVMKVNPAVPDWPARDWFILSKGHAVEALYATLAHRGFFGEELLATYGRDGSPLGGHADSQVAGVDVSSGSLGHGLGQAAGLALASRLSGRTNRVFVLLGDGECYEGSVWEAAQFAAHHELGQVVAIVDRNRQITLDETETCNRQEPFADKWRAFGCDAVEVDGHSIPALLEALHNAIERPARSRPVVIVAHTTKGRGVSFMEREVGWHHRVPSGDALLAAERELDG
jgi:transketolase